MITRTVFVAVLLSALAGAASAVEVELTAKAELKPDKSRDKSYKAKLSGTTNLPPDSKLTVTVSPKDRKGFGGSDSCKVWSDGTFFTGYFGPFPAGEYEAVIQFDPRLQAAGVQAVSGDKGAELAGDLVANLKVGNTEWKIIRMALPFKAGDDAEAAAADASRAKTDAELAERILVLHELIVEFNNRKDLDQWVAFAREFQKQWDEVKDQLKPDAVSAALYGNMVQSHAAVYDVFTACRTGEQAKIDAAQAEFRTAAAPLIDLIERGAGDNSGIEALRAEIERLEADKKEHGRLDNRSEVKRLIKLIREKKAQLLRLVREQEKQAAAAGE